MKMDVRSGIRTLYQSALAKLPPRTGAYVSDLAFVLARRPFSYRDPKHIGMCTRGSVTFSVDFEMAWATQYATDLETSCVELGLRERGQVPLILAKLDECAVPATWATVGHLFLEKCRRGADGLAHEEMPRVPHFDRLWRFTSGDWYQFDPCSSVDRDPAWYAPDLIERIISSPTKHELACHTFSHVGFGPYCPDHVASAELKASVEVMKRFGIRPSTFVFPGNHLGKFSQIAHEGFSCIRAFPISWAEISLPVRHEGGLWWVPGSIGVDVSSPAVILEKRLAHLTKYVDKAVELGLNAHFWFHPSMPRNQLERVLFPLISYCAMLRDKGKLDVFTMEQLVTQMEGKADRSSQTVGQ